MRGRPRKLTRAEIEQICVMYQRVGTSAPMLARLFGVSATTILRAVEGRLKASDD